MRSGMREFSEMTVLGLETCMVGSGRYDVLFTGCCFQLQHPR